MLSWWDIVAIFHLSTAEDDDEINAGEDDHDDDSVENVEKSGDYILNKTGFIYVFTVILNLLL